MSSHHIVRDEQEPALLILNLATIPSSTLNGLLEWSPTIIITADLIDQAVDIGFKFDVVICEQNDLEARSRALNNHSPLVFLSSDKSEILKTVNMYLLSSSHTALSILVDNFETLKESIRPIFEIDSVVYDAEYKWYKPVGIFKKWFRAGQELKIVGSIYELSGVDTRSSKEEDVLIVKQEGVLIIKSSDSIWLGERIV